MCTAAGDGFAKATPKRGSLVSFLLWTTPVRQPDSMFGSVFQCHAGSSCVALQPSSLFQHLQFTGATPELRGWFAWDLHPPCATWLLAVLWWALLKHHHDTESSGLASETGTIY